MSLFWAPFDNPKVNANVGFAPVEGQEGLTYNSQTGQYKRDGEVVPEPPGIYQGVVGQQTPAEIERQQKLLETKTAQLSPSAGADGDPVRAAILAAFRAKGIEPRDEADIQYWIDAVNRTGGWDNPGNRAYWLDRFTHEQGGVGDYLERPESGAGGQGGTQPFNYPAWDQQLQIAPFQPTTGITQENDPGYQARLKFGLDALQNSAGAKGTLLTGQTLNDLNQYAQTFASNEFANVDARNKQNYAINAQTQAQNYLQNYQQYLQGYNQALGIYGTNVGVNQQAFQNALGLENQQFQQQYSLANLGLQGALASSGLGTQYGQQAGNLLTDIGAVQGAGQVGAGNAFGGTLSGLGNYGANLGYLYGFQYPSSYGNTLIH